MVHSFKKQNYNNLTNAQRAVVTIVDNTAKGKVKVIDLSIVVEAYNMIDEEDRLLESKVDTCEGACNFLEEGLGYEIVNFTNTCY